VIEATASAQPRVISGSYSKQPPSEERPSVNATGGPKIHR
jgi:hypothetical protein